MALLGKNLIKATPERVPQDGILITTVVPPGAKETRYR